jgi:O-antigen ligase
MTLVVDRPYSYSVESRSYAPLALQVFAVTLMVFPSDLVLKTVGAGGYVAALVSYCLFLGWVTVTLLGLHNPFEYRSPVRIALCALWLSSIASYAFMNRGSLTGAELAAGDRWLMQIVGVSGVILVASECLNSLEDVRRVLRALTWGGAFCGIVAALQFKLGIDLTAYAKDVLPGFSVNQAAAGNAGIGNRAGFNRVSGTAIDPIELGVCAAMLLPLAISLAIHDVKRSRVLRWLPVICICAAIPASVSRSAFLGVSISLGVFIVSLRSAQRLMGLVGVVLGLVAIFVTAHGLLGEIKSFFGTTAADPSIAHRVDNYSYAYNLIRQSLWFGQGGGTYIPDTLHILDNEYLTSTIDLGLLGLAATTFFFVWPAIAALVARYRTAEPELRDLCAALAGATLAAAVCSVTFDSLGFPMFVNLQALCIGLIGAVWLLVDRARATPPAARSPRQHDGTLAGMRQRFIIGVSDSLKEP